MVLKSSKKFSNVFLKTALLKRAIRKGKLELTENCFILVTKLLQKSYYKNHKQLFKISILNVTPVVFLTRISYKKKLNKQIPYVIKKKKRLLKGIKLLLALFKQKTHQSFKITILNEVILIIKVTQSSKKTHKQILYEYAFMFKKFANYRWF